MRNLLSLAVLGFLPCLLVAQQAKENNLNSSSSLECAVCTQKDSKGNCQVWDFRNCPPETFTNKYKKYKSLTKRYKKSVDQNKVLYANEKDHILNPAWSTFARLDSFTIIVINKNKKLYAQVDCGCCNVTVDWPRLYCKRWWCPCIDPIIRPSYSIPDKGRTY